MRDLAGGFNIKSGLFASIRPNIAISTAMRSFVTKRDLPLLARAFLRPVDGQRFYGVKFCRADMD